MSRSAEGLLLMLGIKNYTNKHAKIIDAWVDNWLDKGQVGDVKVLLTSLGEWEQEDVKTCETWLMTL